MFASYLLEPKVHSAPRLVVIVHGWASSSKKMLEVAELVQTEIPEAACLMIDHDGGGVLSNARPGIIADQIAHIIQHSWDDGAEAGVAFKDIVLIGHSVGALLVRKAYAFACGFDDDSECRVKDYSWASHVDRIISLAGIDRGLPLTTKANTMSWPTFLLRRIAYNITRFARTANFVRSMQRGEPFVANLRIQWIRMMQDEKLTVAPSFQLVGDRDDLVAFRDSVDALFESKNFIYRPVLNASHDSIRLPSRDRDVRREIAAALTCEPKDRSNEHGGEDLTDVFYIMHGIRDIGTKWTSKIGAAIADTIQCENEPLLSAGKVADIRRIRTVRPSYGYFGLMPFLLSWDRQRNVRWFIDIYTQMVARYPKAKHHFVGHSNGTYILASALSRYSTCKVRNVVFAGSVVPSAFDWTKYASMDQVAYVRNDVGSADWVVGLFPHLWELATDALAQLDVNAPAWLDLGSAGFNGFYDDRATSYCYLPGTHDAALNEVNYWSIAHSVVKGEDCEPCARRPQQQPIVEWLSKFAWAVVPGAAAAIVGADLWLWKHHRRTAAGVTILLIGALYTV